MDTMDGGDSGTKFPCSSFYAGSARYFIPYIITGNTDSCAVPYDMSIYFSQVFESFKRIVTESPSKGWFLL